MAILTKNEIKAQLDIFLDRDIIILNVDLKNVDLYISEFWKTYEKMFHDSRFNMIEVHSAHEDCGKVLIKMNFNWSTVLS